MTDPVPPVPEPHKQKPVHWTDSTIIKFFLIASASMVLLMAIFFFVFSVMDILYLLPRG